MNRNKKHIVIKDKKQCCGCGACVAICSKNAIVMVKDEEGFEYPKFKEELCIGCRLCIKVCHWKA